MLTKFIAVCINLAVPGSGLVALGQFRFAFISQVCLIISVCILCWSRLIFEPIAIQGTLVVIGLIYVISTGLCFRSTPSPSKPLQRITCTLLFVIISSLIFTAGYIYKHQWLGIHIYFVPSMSMHPTLKPGQFILVDTWAYQQQPPQKNDVVVFEHDTESLWLVKRISNWPDGQFQLRGLFYVLGDNQGASRDSRIFGGIKQEQIVGEVKLVLLGIDQKHQWVANSLLQPIQQANVSTAF